MDTSLPLILLIIVIFLTFVLINRKLNERLTIFKSFIFILIGILISQPFVNWVNDVFKTNILSPTSDELFKRIDLISFVVLGFVGFSTGARIRIKEMINYSLEHFKLSFIDILFSILLMGGISILVSQIFLSHILSIENILINALILGIASATLSLRIYDNIKNEFQVKGENFNTLCIIPKLNNFFLISLVGLMTVLTTHFRVTNIHFTPIEWFLVSVLIGIILGFLLFIFLEDEIKETNLFISLLGIVIFAVGLALYSNLSPIFLNLILGLVIGNTVKSKEIIMNILIKLEDVFYAILLIYIGSVLEINIFWIFFAGIVIYLTLRYLIKYFNGFVSYKIATDKSKFSSSIGKGLTAQGLVTLAIALNFQQVFDNPLINILFAIIVFSTLINELFSKKIIKDLLIDLNEIR